MLLRDHYFKVEYLEKFLSCHSAMKRVAKYILFPLIEGIYYQNPDKRLIFCSILKIII